MAFPTVDIRPRRSLAFFAVLSIAMVLFSYFFVIALAAACVYLPYTLIQRSDPMNGQLFLALLFGIAIASTLLWSLVPRPDKFKSPGLLLDRATQPRLFTELENIATALSEPMPEEVYLIGDINAWVADRGGFGGFGSRRVMGLGLPLMSILTVSQFRAVLAHEFAHYYGGDTSLGPWVYRTQTAMVRVFQNMGSLRRATRIAILSLMYVAVATAMKWYFMIFLRAMNLASRQREYRADELACLIAGSQPLIDGLRAINGAGPAWPAYWKNELAPVLNGGAMPGIAEGFSRFVSVPAVQELILKSLDKQIQEPKTTPYDTHPPLRDRIAAAGKFFGELVREDSRPARSLLDHPDATEIRFLERTNPDMKPGSLKCISWDEAATQVTIPRWKSFAAEHVSYLQGVTVASLPDQIPKLGGIGDRMRDPKGMLLGPEQRRQRAGHLFGVGLGLALLDHGWSLNLSPGIFSLGKAGAAINPFLLVQQLMQNKMSAQDWTAQCSSLGIGDLLLAPAATVQADTPDRSAEP
jgi:heat shock protein HtpX